MVAFRDAARVAEDTASERARGLSASPRFAMGAPGDGDESAATLAVSLNGGDDGGAGETTDAEARSELLARFGRSFGALPAAVLVEHILDATRGGDWPVRLAAMEALQRRWSACRRDDLRPASRPAKGRIFGAYSIRPKGKAPRPYTCRFDSFLPPRGSCDCPDFLRSSLGLCKHLFAVLSDIAARPRSLRLALDAASETARDASRGREVGLRWDPVRPLIGRGDWLDRVRWVGDERTPLPDRIRPYFRRIGKHDEFELQIDGTDPVVRRRAVIDALSSLAKVSTRAGRDATDLVDPAIAALARDEKERLARHDPGFARVSALRSALRGLARPLYPYQLEGVHRFLACGRLLLADDMGLGKTAQAIASCHALYGTGKVRRGLIVAPASLKPQWLREWQLFTRAPAEILDGSPSERRRVIRARKSGFLIVNYEQVIRDIDELIAFDADIVVLDEAQRIKNWATKTARQVKRLRPRYRLVLTGTPLENRLDELASIFDWVDDQALEPKWRLVPWHSRYADGRRDVVGARNLDTLRERIRPTTVRRLRREVLGQLPPRTDSYIPVEMSAAQREEHDALIAPIVRLMTIARKRPLTREEFLRLMQLLAAQRVISNGLAQFQFEEIWPDIAMARRRKAALLESLSSPKLVAFRDLMGQLLDEDGRKVVVFSQWRRMLLLAEWAIRPLMEEHGARAVFFTGHESTKRRTHNVVDFHDDPATRVMFCSDSGGVGLNLQRAATCCIQLELPWNPAVLEQRVGRIYRIGQEQPIHVYNLANSYGIESRIARIVDSKRALFEGLFDGASDEVEFESSGSFLARLEQLMEPDGEGDRATSGAAGELEVDEDDVDGTALDAGIDAAIDRIDETRDAGSEDGIDQAASVKPSPSSSAERIEERRAEDPRSDLGEEVRQLFGGVEVQRRADGSLRIEAEPAAAETLAALFEGVAGLLRAAGR